MRITPIIRFADIKDLSSIVEIYNQAIRSNSATGDMIEFTVAQRVDWFNSFDHASFPIYTAEFNNRVVGYATLSPYRKGRQAMNKVAEISFFIDYSYHGLGIGSALVSYAISDCERIGKESLLAILLDINPESVRLLKKFSFEEWGYLPDIIDFNGQKCGHLIYGLNLKNRKDE
ncbi:MAG TPA: N-acetyltransferase family protein [Bacteroidales bacterium]|jgi:phosphinothricin acetyltransferase|nr:N-acetyltransferase family protein [Bacteroidales bacterium]|tara:strand:- start:1829 stop:2350 length:522 start_codon:yes stop_codon:yes gene_type:complete